MFKISVRAVSTGEDVDVGLLSHVRELVFQVCNLSAKRLRVHSWLLSLEVVLACFLFLLYSEKSSHKKWILVFTVKCIVNVLI